MKNQGKNILFDILLSFFILIFAMLDVVLIFGRSYEEIDVNAQATIFSPIPSSHPSATPTVTPLLTPTTSPTKTITTTTSSSESAKQSGQNFPSRLLDLTNWKLTLPKGDQGKPTEIKQPDLEKFMVDPWFMPQGAGVRFRAAVNGVTTGGSKYPRSELREMTDEGKKQAGWSSTSGSHTLYIDQAIMVVPTTKKHIVAGQIHDGDDDVLVIRLEYPNLYVNVDGDNEYTLESNYTLGKRFNVKFEVGSGKTKVYYNGSTNPVFTLTKDYSDAYFKAGAYIQSNCETEESAPCNEANYGEVIIYQLSVSHE